MKRIGFAVVGLALIACSSSSDPPAPQCVVTGTYIVNITKDNGTCDAVYASPRPQTQTYTIDAAPDYAANAFLYQPQSGPGCVILANGCKLDDVCKFAAKGGAGDIAFHVSVMFDKTGGFSGIETESIPAIPMIGAEPAKAACDETDNVAGKLRQ